MGRTVIKYPQEVLLLVRPIKPSESEPNCNRELNVKGSKGELNLPLHPFIEIIEPAAEGEKKLVSISVLEQQNKTQKEIWGLTRALLSNMIIGVSDGFTLPIRIVGVGYRALFEQEKLSLKIGVSHPVLIDIPKGIKVEIPAPQRIILSGANWPQITQFAAVIRNWRKPEPYNQKGIFVGDETIKKLEGKKR